MGNDSSIAILLVFYAIQVLTFSAILLLLVKNDLRTPILFWIGANIMSVIEITARLASLKPTASPLIPVSMAILSALSGLIRYYSIRHGAKSSPYSNYVLIFIFLIWLIVPAIKIGWLSSFLAYSAGSALLLLSAWEANRNPLWKGLAGRPIVIAGFLLCAAAIFWRGTLFIASQNSDQSVVNVTTTLTGITLVSLSSLMLQIGFLSLIAGHDLRNRRLRDQQTAEALEISRGMAEEQLVMETVANERLDMISLLTHEVRQPINSAQAALEALARETKGSAPADAEMRDALVRAQSVLDEITLSISNAILGVSLIDNKQAITTFASDLVEIVELALSDCPAEQRHRIHIHGAGGAVFSNLDPVLIRLALRNLFDNALKYSPQDSSVHVEIAQDDQRLGASIKVSNPIKDASGLNDDMFGRRVRGAKVDVEGSGHGLYLVEKVAAAHSGTIRYTIKDGQYVTFDLFVPD
jgi:signal transduction histidine kinase